MIVNSTLIFVGFRHYEYINCISLKENCEINKNIKRVKGQINTALRHKFCEKNREKVVIMWNLKRLLDGFFANHKYLRKFNCWTIQMRGLTVFKSWWLHFWSWWRLGVNRRWERVLSSHSISSTLIFLNNMDLNSPFVKGTSI